MGLKGVAHEWIERCVEWRGSGGGVMEVEVE